MCVFFLFLFSLLALWFLELYCSFTMYKWGAGGGGEGVSMFNETAHLLRMTFTAAFVFARERLLPCRVGVGSVGCIVNTDYVYPAFVPLLADISCLYACRTPLSPSFSPNLVCGCVCVWVGGWVDVQARVSVCE